MDTLFLDKIPDIKGTVAHKTKCGPIYEIVQSCRTMLRLRATKDGGLLVSVPALVGGGARVGFRLLLLVFVGSILVSLFFGALAQTG